MSPSETTATTGRSERSVNHQPEQDLGPGPGGSAPPAGGSNSVVHVSARSIRLSRCGQRPTQNRATSATTCRHSAARSAGNPYRIRSDRGLLL